jgi:hypothetical protein
MNTEIDYAYLAGILDGEGCFQIEKHNRIKTQDRLGNDHIVYKYRATITVAMNDKTTIERIAAIFSGASIFGCKNNKKHTSWVIRWRSHTTVREIINSTLKYLTTSKREQAELILKFIELKKGFQRKDCRNKMVTDDLAEQYTKLKEKVSSIRTEKWEKI